MPTYMAPFQMVAASASTDGMPSLPCMHNVAVDVASPEASAPASVVRGGGAPAGGSSSGGRPAAAAPPRPVRMFEAVDALTDAPLFVAATSSERVPPLTRWERSATKPQTAAVSMLASLLRSVAARARAKKAARMEWHELMAWDRDDMADVVPNDVAFAITVRHVGDLVVPRATGRWSAAALADARFSYVAYRARVSHPDTLQRAVDITTQLVAVRLHDTSVRREVAKAALTGARVPVTVHAALMEAGLPAHVRFVAVPRTRPCTTGEASALRDAGDTGGAVGARVTGFAAAQLTD